jgi:hypothetical protein
MANYRGKHRKYVRGTSEYENYSYGDVVTRLGVFYVCGVTGSFGYIPEEPASGFLVFSGGASGITGDYVVSFNGATGEVVFSMINGGTYNV